MSQQRSFHDDPALYGSETSPPTASVQFYIDLARQTRGEAASFVLGGMRRFAALVLDDAQACICRVGDVAPPAR